jgi:hypothetical protein
MQGLNFRVKWAQHFLLKKGHFLIENPEGKSAFEHKETGRAPRQLRWAPALDAVVNF